MGVIERDSHYLHGVRYWRQLYPQSIPRFHVYRYVGRDADRGLYYFKGVRDNTLLWKSHYQLYQNGFGPFVLDTARLARLAQEGA